MTIAHSHAWCNPSLNSEKPTCKQDFKSERKLIHICVMSASINPKANQTEHQEDHASPSPAAANHPISLDLCSKILVSEADEAEPPPGFSQTTREKLEKLWAFCRSPSVAIILQGGGQIQQRSMSKSSPPRGSCGLMNCFKHVYSWTCVISFSSPRP